MNTYRADLHIHTVLSPCGDLEMSPVNIVKEAARKGLDIIAVADHNHTGHAKLTRELGKEFGIWVVYASEVTSSEEVHCLTFFDTDQQLEAFQEYINENIPRLANDNRLFGYQVIVDREEQIMMEVQHSLYPGIRKGITQIADYVHELGGLFVPAHVDRKMNGLYAQMGFYPENLDSDAVEIHRSKSREEARKDYPELKDLLFLKSSDAHFLEDIGRCASKLIMESRNFDEFRLAINGEKGRSIVQE